METVKKAQVCDMDIWENPNPIFEGTMAECQKYREENGWDYQNESGQWFERKIFAVCPHCGERMQWKNNIEQNCNGWECQKCGKTLWDGQTFTEGDIDGLHYAVTYHVEPGLFNGIAGGGIETLQVFKGNASAEFSNGTWNHFPYKRKIAAICKKIIEQYSMKNNLDCRFWDRNGEIIWEAETEEYSPMELGYMPI